MGKNELFYDKLIGLLQETGQRSTDIIAVYVLGARAEKSPFTDQWSDLDILVYTKQPELYLETSDFVAQFGTV